MEGVVAPAAAAAAVFGVADAFKCSFHTAYIRIRLFLDSTFAAYIA